MYGEMGESIYNIIPPKMVEQEKPPMYRSKHNPGIPPTASTFHQRSTTHPSTSNLAGEAADKLIPDKAARTLGKPNGMSRNYPEQFHRDATKTQVKPLHVVRRENPELLKPSTLKTKLKPGVPPVEEEPVMNLATSKNFIVANAVETILAAPKKVSQGAKDYLRKEDYGKVPKYLQHIKKDIELEYEYIRTLEEQREEMSRPQVLALEEQERQRLIAGLKAKWEQVNTEYQATTHITKLDTMGKIKRKEKWEAELSQIEKDIERLNRRNIQVDCNA